MIDCILVKCYWNAMLSIIGYHCLWLAYPYLFVCVFVVSAMIV